MKFSPPTRWLIYTALYAAPYLFLMVGGMLWLVERGWVWHWLIANAVIMVVLWVYNHRRGRRVQATGTAESLVQPDPRWTPAGEAAWQEVGQISTRYARPDLPLNDPQGLWNIVHEVLTVVARRFHPKADQPVLEIPVPYVLRILELVAADLRAAFSAHVPGAHILTLRDFQRMKKLADLSQQLYDVYRFVRLGLNPAAAILGEAREAVYGRFSEESTAELKQWMIRFVIQKTGYYAIQLYSGQVVLSDVDFETFHSRQTQREEKESQARDAAVSAEPLRVLVLGQVKAGKSSLINALFGATQAAVDVVPRTTQVDPYVLERDGMQRAIIFDTAGFAVDDSEKRNPFDALRQPVIDSDLVLVVCTALSASRSAEQKFLEAFRAYFADEPNRAPPPIVVVLTHIDQLRPWQEWSPPYHLGEDDRPKAKNIAAAAAAVARDLHVPPDRVIPVSLGEGRSYNVEDALIPAILHVMNDAQRAKYQRCLRQAYDEQYWQQLWRQAANSGRWLRKAIEQF